MSQAEAIGQARQWLAAAKSIAVLTGAGVSAESGVPTFRDALTGHWANFRPEELASEAGFRAQPQRVWDWYAGRRDELKAVQPNAGHHALAQFQQRHPGRLTLITQNVDGLHQKAGSPGVLALHGDIHATRWLDAFPGGCSRANRPDEVCDVSEASPGRPPRCESCGSLLRPSVVWFGEMLPVAELEAAQQAADHCDVMLVVGTSGVVYPAAGLAHQAREAGARVLVLNPAASDLDDIAHLLLRATAATGLPALLDGL